MTNTREENARSEMHQEQLRNAAWKVVCENPSISPDEFMDYEDWLEVTGRDASFVGNGRDIPGTEDIYDAAIRALEQRRKFDPWPDFTRAMRALNPEMAPDAVVYKCDAGNNDHPTTTLWAAPIRKNRTVGSPVKSTVSKEWLNAFVAREIPVGAPRFAAGKHWCRVDISVTDPQAFAEWFAVAPEDVSTDNLTERLFSPFSITTFGATLEEVLIERRSPENLTVLLGARIHDPRIFNESVADAGRVSGFESDWQPKDAGEAIFEAWCGLNDTPSPDGIGIQIDHGAEADGPASLDRDMHDDIAPSH